MKIHNIYIYIRRPLLASSVSEQSKPITNCNLPMANLPTHQSYQYTNPAIHQACQCTNVQWLLWPMLLATKANVP